MTAAAWERAAALWAHPGVAGRYGEDVTIGEHMLQAAALAAADGAPPPLVAAALLHDVGHLVDADVPADRRNRDHDDVGHRMLTDVFPAEVTEPVRLHVAAKRHLVAADPDYRTRLSPASIHTLALQGGPMTPEEQDTFLDEPHHGAALTVRRWDEAAKVPGLRVAPLAHYRALLEALPPC